LILEGTAEMLHEELLLELVCDNVKKEPVILIKPVKL
jgi:hypothetical protein